MPALEFNTATPGGAADGIGEVASVRGSEAVIRFAINNAALARPTVGKFVGIAASPQSRVIGLITEMAAAEDAGGPMTTATARVDLMGEVEQDDAEPRFRRGVNRYPAIGDPAFLLSEQDLRRVYRASSAGIEVGCLHQDATIPATLDVNGLLNKHFAILGTTGVGKSSALAVIVREAVEVRRDIRVFVIDGHNEYGRCFEERAHVVTPRELKLPFWLFNFEELCDVIFGGRPVVEDEVEILAELIPFAKGSYTQYKNASDRSLLKRVDPRGAGFTVDTPVPYLLQDLLTLIDERMGRLENRATRMSHHRLIGRIEAIANDPRYAFMFENANVGGDTMADLLSSLFRIEPDGRPISVMQFAGMPAEVVDAVVCLLARLAFDFGLWSDGAVPLLFVCEEAHRYAAADKAVGFAPTRRALLRIAKEGRKYGVSLGLVTQRPAELDPTIISQCSTLLAMRLANHRDQALLRSAVSDTAANLIAFVPTLGTGEVVGFGEGVPLPARMLFKPLPAHLLPRTDTTATDDLQPDRAFIRAIVERWRGASTRKTGRVPETAAPEAVPPKAPAGAAMSRLDQTRYQILKR